MMYKPKNQSDKKGYWLNELVSLGIQPKRKNDLNDKEELEALADNIKQVHYQDYKTAYDDNDNDDKEEIDDPRLDYII
jgi:hypothetical protein